MLYNGSVTNTEANMLIAVSGSQGIGKSTFIRELEKSGWKTIQRKTSRSILSDWGVTLDQVNSDIGLLVKFQDEILSRKIADEQEAINSQDMWITERTAADLFTYANLAVGKFNSHSKWIDEYYIRCMEAQKRYDHVLYLTNKGRLGSTVVEDGVRSTNGHYSEMVDIMMQLYTERLCKAHAIPLTLIDCGLVSDRMNIVLDIFSAR